MSDESKEKQGGAGDKPGTAGAAADKGGAGDGADKAAGSGNGGGKTYSQAEMDRIAAEVKANAAKEERTRIEREQAEARARETMTETQKREQAERKAAQAEANATQASRRADLLSRSIRMSQPVPPEFIDAVLASSGQDTEFDPDKALNAASKNFTAFLSANGYTRSGGKAPDGDGSGDGAGSGEGRQAGSGDDEFTGLTREQIRTRMARDPKFRDRYIERSEKKYAEQTGRA